MIRLLKSCVVPNPGIVAAGNGWRIAGEGQALAPGVEGRTVRVRTESGRIVDGVASGEREVEVAL
jgi:flagella basal body P-ring formation protein FlgA